MQRPAEDLDDGVVYVIVDSYTSDEHQMLPAEDAAAMEEIDGPLRLGVKIGGGGSIQRLDHGYLVSLTSDLSRAKLSSLGALGRVELPDALDPDRILLHRGEGPIIEEFLELDERTCLELDSSGVLAVVEQRYVGPPNERPADYWRQVDSVAHNYGCRVTDIQYRDVYGDSIDEERRAALAIFDEEFPEEEPVDWFADMVHVVEIKIACDDPHARASKLIDCGCAVHDYLDAIRGGELDAPRIVSVLRGGHIGVLVGRRENEFVDVKQSLYNINAPGQTGERQKIELAQDVARFANGDTDAVLVIGFTESKSRGVTLIGRQTPIDLTNFDASQYQAVLDEKIIPAISGLSIEAVQTDANANSGIVVIYVPRQPEELQPYLVQGAVVADKVEGAFFSIVQRRGEASITVRASQIHTYIVAGKAFLRRTD